MSLMCKNSYREYLPTSFKQVASYSSNPVNLCLLLLFHLLLLKSKVADCYRLLGCVIYLLQISCCWVEVFHVSDFLCWQRNCKGVFLLLLADVRHMVHNSWTSMSGLLTETFKNVILSALGYLDEMEECCAQATMLATSIPDHISVWNLISFELLFSVSYVVNGHIYIILNTNQIPISILSTIALIYMMQFQFL